MYAFLLHLHSNLRWLVLISLLVAIYRGIKGWTGGGPFKKSDNSIRHITATIAHIQLTVGAVLYFNSPIISYFWKHRQEAMQQPALWFFSLLHISLMTAAVILITIGSAKAARETADGKKFRIMAIWYIIALIVIFMAIPWPFSPLAARPYSRF